MATKEKDPCIVVTGPDTLFSYVRVFEPDDENGKYGLALVISKDDTETLKKIKRAIDAAYEKGIEIGKFPKTKKLAALKTPLRDGDEEKPDDTVYENSYFINARSTKAPDVVDAARNKLDGSAFWSGCIGRASVSFYPYNEAGNQGIGCGLRALMKLKEGEMLAGGGGVSDFDGYEDDGDPFSLAD